MENPNLELGWFGVTPILGNLHMDMSSHLMGYEQSFNRIRYSFGLSYTSYKY